MTLHTSTGALVPVTLEPAPGVWVIHPNAPLESDAGYYLQFGTLCGAVCPPDGGQPSGPCTYQAPFVTGGLAQVPTAAGPLALAAYGVTDRGSGDGCGGPGGKLAWASVNFTPDVGVQPWMPVTAWHLEVDGNVWASAPIGWNPAASTAVPGATYSRSIRMVHARCDTAADAGGAADPGVAPGTHTVQLIGQIAGTDASIPSASLQIELDCNAGEWMAGSDGGPPPATDGGTQSSSDAGALADAGSSPGEPSGSSGCTAAGGEGSLFGFGLLVAAFRRRRR